MPPRHILVNGRRIRLRWLQQIIWSFLAANIGSLIISGLYYLFVQLRWHVGGHTILYLKPDWDHLFSFHGWTADRHDVRNVYEAVLATLFVKSLLANWRKNDRRAPAWYVVISPFLIVIVAFASGFLFGLFTGQANPNPSVFLNSVFRAIHPFDAIGFLVKCLLPALFTGVICATEGLGVQGGVTGVPLATKRALAWSLGVLFLTSAVVSVLTYS